MRDGLGLKLDMEHEYHIKDKTFHIAERMTYKAMILIANTMAMVLINKDKVTGVARENVLMREPLLVFEMFDVLTDFNMEEYRELEDDVVLTFYEDVIDFVRESDKLYGFFYKIEDAYTDVSIELKRQIKDANSVGALLRSFGKYMDGDGTQKDVGLIRKMLTDFLIKAKKPEKDEKEAEPEKPENNVVDLSMYRVKEDKKK